MNESILLEASFARSRELLYKFEEALDSFLETQEERTKFPAFTPSHRRLLDVVAERYGISSTAHEWGADKETELIRKPKSKAPALTLQAFMPKICPLSCLALEGDMLTGLEQEIREQETANPSPSSTTAAAAATSSPSRPQVRRAPVVAAMGESHNARKGRGCFSYVPKQQESREGDVDNDNMHMDEGEGGLAQLGETAPDLTEEELQEIERVESTMAAKLQSRKVQFEEVLAANIRKEQEQWKKSGGSEFQRFAELNGEMRWVHHPTWKLPKSDYLLWFSLSPNRDRAGQYMNIEILLHHGNVQYLVKIGGKPDENQGILCSISRSEGERATVLKQGYVGSQMSLDAIAALSATSRKARTTAASTRQLQPLLVWISVRKNGLIAVGPRSIGIRGALATIDPNPSPIHENFAFRSVESEEGCITGIKINNKLCSEICSFDHIMLMQSPPSEEDGDAMRYLQVETATMKLLPAGVGDAVWVIFPCASDAVKAYTKMLTRDGKHVLTPLHHAPSEYLTAAGFSVARGMTRQGDIRLARNLISRALK